MSAFSDIISAFDTEKLVESVGEYDDLPELETGRPPMPVLEEVHQMTFDDELNRDYGGDIDTPPKEEDEAAEDEAAEEEAAEDEAAEDEAAEEEEEAVVEEHDLETNPIEIYMKSSVSIYLSILCVGILTGFFISKALT
jgi:hypothetical protein